ncbi:hypothetical protein MKUB_14060 [Mycobacterium kubicae]|uniref:PE domain-containing protein n=1 Tax=Mycobacterium kubicae TaxID=120959 RepID=A0AAX1JCU3_9MYCO|nr:PE domain-containing protein [Mycobacterium kubicae]MCV7095758.1 PE domain-containing protein [Mycobacterium kubicae]ORV99689.1 lipase [Mycobacterium kubicae]QNI11136.1 PE domain-containing protein [Mycobacterium kubicae]QPI39348.1 PE domain-containing protein [Mycobacterium kubicae]GFG63916.1 hypothetical protein MKUB_14060 [Mycobacterium kubicae]
MSSVVVVPEWLTAAAANVAEVGSTIEEANAAVAAQTTGVLAAAEDEVSAAIAALFSAHGEGYQAFSAQAALFHDRFVQALANASGAYAAAEAASVSPLAAFEQAVLGVEQGIQQLPTTIATEFSEISNYFFTQIFGAPAAPPFPASQTGGFSGAPSLITRFEEALLYPVKPILALSGIEPQLSVPGSPILSFLGAELPPPLSWLIGNSPPPFLNMLLGETVQYTTYNGMSVVQITPAHPTGDYVVAIHGGAFILPPSIFHWINYSVMAYQTGATFEVPIYPLLQQGGTAGTVVPLMSNFISSMITPAHPHVSVIGDSAGGNLALAAVEYMAANPNTYSALPTSMVLLSPWLDLGMTNPNIGFVQDPLLPVGPAQQIGRAWANGLDIMDPMVSPLYGVSNLPPGFPTTYVYSGNLDILSPDVFRLQEFAKADAAPFYFVLGNGQIHDWTILTLDGPQYWQQIGQELIAA